MCNRLVPDEEAVWKSEDKPFERRVYYCGQCNRKYNLKFNRNHSAKCPICQKSIYMMMEL